MELHFREWLAEYAGEEPTRSFVSPVTTSTLPEPNPSSTMGTKGSNQLPGTHPDNDYKNTYVHPDMIWKSQPETTFFYTRSGKLWTFPGHITHQQALIGKKTNESEETIDTEPALPTSSQAFGIRPGSNSWHQPPNRQAFQDIFGPNADLRVLTQRDNFTKAALLGRTGAYNGKKYASFWNSPDTLVKQLMMPCLKALLEKKAAGSDYLVSHPNLKDIPIAQILKDGLPDMNANPAAEEWARKARELHLMPSDQKRKAMRELGLGAGGANSPRTAYQRAMQNANIGYHAPWRGTSESSS